MANKRANPLSGSFKSPPSTKETKEAAKAELEDKAGILGNTGKPAEEKKPPELPKDGKEQKASGADGPAKPAEVTKPPEPPKDGKEQKASGADGPAKPTEETKPPEPPKDEKEQKASGADGPAKPAEETKPPEPPKDGKEQKASGADGPAKPAEETKPPEPPEQPKDPKLRFVKLSEIGPLPGTYVKDTPREDYSDLIASIKEHGLEQPVMLRQSEKGGYNLVHGFHRCEALKRAGMLEVRADVYAMSLSQALEYRKNRDKNPPIPGTLILPFPAQEPEQAAGGEKDEKPSDAAKAPLPPGAEKPEATHTAEGPKGSTVTHIFDDRLDAPGDSEMHSLPIPKEGEVYSLALHPAYFRDFLDHPFTVNRETQDYKELFESIKTYGIREPVKCRPGRDGGVEIISGHRRHDIGMRLNYPIPTIIEQISDDSRLEKIYHLTAADDPADIPTADFEREGYQYTLLDLTRTDKAETDTKYYSETVTFDSSSKDMDTILPQLAATCEADTEDGYSGTLTLDTANIKVEASGYSSSSRTVSATRTYPNLSDADLSLIPKTTQESGRTLSLADVQWKEAGSYYTATASYTGTASTKYATGYTVTATYTGEVSRTTNSAATYVATFSGVPNGTRILPREEEADTSENASFPWVLLIPAAAGVVGLAYGGKFLYGKYKIKKEWKEYNK